jgi:hypothetical protein
MVVREMLRDYYLRDIENLNILFFDSKAREKNKFFKRMYDKKIISDEGIEKALAKPIEERLKFDLNLMFFHSYHADHIGNPEVLAYALQNNFLPPELIGKIPFDHGDTVETYIKEYGQGNLPSNLRERLLNPEPKPVYNHAWDLDPEDCDHCVSC